MSAENTDRDRRDESNPQLEQSAASDESITEVHQQLLREKPEPREGFAPTPVIIVFLFSALSFAGALYLSRFSGGFQPLVFDTTVDVYSAAEPSEPAEVDMVALGRRMYAQCAACHQMSGQGVPGAFPPLVDSDWVTGDEQRLIRLVLFGLQGPIEVEGTTYNGVMPAFGPGSGYRFNPQQIAAVLTYVRSEWGNDAAEVTVDKVEEVLAQHSDRGPNQAWTVDELEQVE